MCIRNGGAAADEDDDDSVIKQPIRRTRSKTRRPKFVSLRLELISPENSQSSSLGMSPKQLVNGGRHQLQQPPPPPQQQQHQIQQQLNLFPLHPENLMEVEDRECMQDENVAFIFNNDVGSTACCSLQSFLPNYQTAAISVSSEEDSLNFGYSEVGDASSLVRTAMRSRERDAREEEKWVCYSEVVEKKEPASSSSDHQVEELEVTSSAAAADDWIKKKKKKKKKVEIRKQLSLKLDYQGILNAWSDKAPLFIKGESPQTVPSLHDDQSLRPDSFANRVMEGVGSEGNVWKVPEMEGLKMAQREASVLRYKEKRQSRLFSKRIRYQVRKLNAEKRPRMKGRFVKRS